MEIQLNKITYQKVIDKNIKVLNKYMPKYSLEKKHIIDVLTWSIQQIYDTKNKEINTNKKLTSDCCNAEAYHIESYKCSECGQDCEINEQ